MDWSTNPGVDWPTDAMFSDIDLHTIVRFAPQALTKPWWLLDFIRNGGLPTLTVPNYATREQPSWKFVEALGLLNTGARPSWDDVAWVKERWGTSLPFLVKGVMHPDDARAAADAGATAISVSTHGGNDFDSQLSPIAALPAIVDAVGDRLEVLLDGGVRRGSDVVKALALGARAVLVGRPYLWALAARGEDGVYEMLEFLRRGIEQAMRVVSAPTIADLERRHVLLPADVERRVAVASPTDSSPPTIGSHAWSQ